MAKLLKSQLHRRPTYEVLVQDTVLNPKDKIGLPDREATILRKTQQLTKYDEVGFLDLEKDNENIQKQICSKQICKRLRTKTQTARLVKQKH